MQIEYNGQNYEINMQASWLDDSIDILDPVSKTTSPRVIPLKDGTVVFGSNFTKPIRADLANCTFIQCTFAEDIAPPETCKVL